MRGGVVQGQVEGSVVTPANKLDRAVRQEVGHIAGLVHRNVSLMQIQLPGRCAVAEVIHCAAQNAVKFIEAMSHWTVLGKETQMPLADQSGGVARRLKERGWCGVLWRKTHAVSVYQRLLQADGKPSGVSSGHKGDPGRAADRCRGVVTGEAESFTSQPINIRSAIVRPAVAAQIAISEVIGEYEQNVRSSGPGHRSRGSAVAAAAAKLLWRKLRR